MDTTDGRASSDRTGPGRPDDLRSLAALDAMGMLDEVDAAAFDRAFRDAVPSVQAEIRELQASVASDPAFLACSEEPSPDLKARTLARVMTEVDRDERTLAPIAHIGRTASRPGRAAGPVIDQQAFLNQAIELATARQDLRRFSRSSYYWRAATIALTAALTVAFVFQVTTRSFAERVAELALGAASTNQLLEAIGREGAGRDIELATALRGMRGVGGSGTGVALLAVNEASGHVTLVGLGLRARGNYIVRTAAGNVLPFTAQRANWSTEAYLSDAQLAAIRSGPVELVDVDSGDVVMSS
jgi:hypothetical protein